MVSRQICLLLIMSRETPERPNARSVAFAIKELVRIEEVQSEGQLFHLAAERWSLYQEIQQMIYTKPVGFVRTLVRLWPQRAKELAPILEQELPFKWPGELKAEFILRKLIDEIDNEQLRWREFLRLVSNPDLRRLLNEIQVSTPKNTNKIF